MYYHYPEILKYLHCVPVYTYNLLDPVSKYMDPEEAVVAVDDTGIINPALLPFAVDKSTTVVLLAEIVDAGILTNTLVKSIELVVAGVILRNGADEFGLDILRLPVIDNDPVIRADPVNGNIAAAAAFNANDAVVEKLDDTAFKTYDAVVAVPIKEPEKDPVATTVSVDPPLNASIARVTCSACIVPPDVIPVLFIIAIYVPFFIY